MLTPKKVTGAKIFRGKSPTAKVLHQNLKVMDSTAISLCMDNGMPIVVFNMNQPGKHSPRRAWRGGRRAQRSLRLNLISVSGPWTNGILVPFLGE